MSTGDLLVIFAFIVLPTIILVSCIWTLLLIRAGVLLPTRRVVTNDADASADVDDQVMANAVETTAVHDVAVPATGLAPATIEVVEDAEVIAETPALPEPEPVPALEPLVASTEPELEAETEPAEALVVDMEHTTDFPIVDVPAQEETATTADEPAEPAPDVISLPEPTPVVEQPANEPVDVPRPAAASAAPDLEILFVPLPDDDPAPAAMAASDDGFISDAPDDEMAAADDEENESADERAERRSGRSRRKPVRRVAQLRPSEEQVSSVSPMGHLLRRSRSGSSR